MRTTHFIASVSTILALALSACNTATDMFSVSTSVEDKHTLRIDQKHGDKPFLEILDVSAGLENSYADLGYAMNEFEQTHVQAIGVFINFQSDIDIKNYHDLEVVISDPITGKSEVIGYLSEPTNGSNRIELMSTLADLDRFFKAGDSYDLKVNLPEEFSFRTDITAIVTVKFYAEGFLIM